MSRTEKRRKIAVTASGALIAAILGAATQELLDTRLRLAAAVVVVVSLGTIASIAALMALVESRSTADAELVTEMRTATADHERLTRSLGNEIRTLSQHIGIRVDTMMLSELNRATSVEDRTVQLMLTATREIRVLDLLLEEGQWPNDAILQSHQDNAFDAFVEMLRHRVRPVAYKRVIQVSDPANSLRRARTGRLLKHCRGILALQQEKGHRASLRVTRRRFPFKFILIDDTGLVLQLSRLRDLTDNDRARISANPGIHTYQRAGPSTLGIGSAHLISKIHQFASGIIPRARPRIEA
ncbi:hypothetical protein GA0074694_4380 [Micromonospora inyonensis]|uniref:Uncharacterized protein n=2 Tax=Micromonospora inyonensis TaxID=47866 RepID=A0A1C6S990_9ACTN|nr:hypothetical protein GA0074694_4380 [Micromonospora inyonensis]